MVRLPHFPSERQSNNCRGIVSSHSQDAFTTACLLFYICAGKSALRSGTIEELNHFTLSYLRHIIRNFGNMYLPSKLNWLDSVLRTVITALDNPTGREACLYPTTRHHTTAVRASEPIHIHWNDGTETSACSETFIKSKDHWVPKLRYREN
jgi:hypothetical protein